MTGALMRHTLLNSFLGILTTSEVHELIDIFKGKGRRKVTPYLEKYMAKIKQDDSSGGDDLKRSFLQGRILERGIEGEPSREEILNSEDQLKGVLFILDSFRKTKTSQNRLKSREVYSLYQEINDQSVFGTDSLKDASSFSKSKGILVNKKHY